MAPPIRVGDTVQTSLGKGVVRELRNKGRLVVAVKNRTLVLTESEVSVQALDSRKRTGASPSEGRTVVSYVKRSGPVAREVDLHGLTVEEAIAQVDSAINEALLANLQELRLIHGKSGGRIRLALHRRLREVASVRGFRLDPANEGVTIVAF